MRSASTTRTASRGGALLRAARLVAAALALAVVAIAVTAVLGLGRPQDGAAPPDPTGLSGPTDGAGEVLPPISTSASIGSISGHLPRQGRQRLLDQVTPVVDRWIDAAYLAGPWPRTDFGDAFAVFTPGARADASTDLVELSNARIGGRLDDVVATRRRLVVDALVVGGHAVGVTAHVLLDFDTTAELVRHQHVRGRVLMTWHRDSGWQIFGYDLARGSSLDQPLSATERSGTPSQGAAR